jgi:carboxyl-terminal processing protease
MTRELHRRIHCAAVFVLGLACFNVHGADPTSAATADAQLAIEPVEQVEPAEERPEERIEPTTLEPLDIHSNTSLTIVEQLRHSHYIKKTLDDGVSSDIFEKYLEMLDGGHAYFVGTDVAEFEKFRYTIDDSLKRGDLDPAYKMFNRYQTRVVDRLHFLIDSIAAGLENVDFTVDEMIELDRENATWPHDMDEYEDLWRKRLKTAVLSMKLSDKELPEIAELLTKRYKNRLKQTLQTKSEDAFQIYVNAFASTYDPHTQYFSPRTSQNFNINMSLSLEGIGAVLKSEDDYTSVVRLVPAGPADKSGNVHPADKIISVGQGETGALIDVVGWRLDDVVELIRGPKDSTVRLEVIPAEAEDDSSKVVQITRNTVQLEEQAAQAKLLTINQGGPDYRVGVIDIPTFYVDFAASQQGDPNFRSTTRDVRNLIVDLEEEGIDGLIIDLRDNGGGSLQEADTMTGLFIKSGPTVQVKSARRRPSVYSDTDDQVAYDGPMAVMVNRLSASASEIFAGAMQDYGRALILGSQTFGKGTVQTLIPLNRGQLKITAAKFYRVSGQSTQHQGILPDVGFPDLYDAKKIGESSLDDAMPWDMIEPAVYDESAQFEPFLIELNKRHQARVEANPDFNYYRALVDKGRENSLRTHISLNESTRIEEKSKEDAWRLHIENDLRIAKDKPAAESLDQLEEFEEAEGKSETPDAHGGTVAQDDSSEDADTSANADEIADVKDDAMIEEAGQILLDLIGLSLQVAQLEAVQTTPAVTDTDANVPGQATVRTDG